MCKMDTEYERHLTMSWAYNGQNFMKIKTNMSILVRVKTYNTVNLMFCKFKLTNIFNATSLYDAVDHGPPHFPFHCRLWLAMVSLQFCISVTWNFVKSEQRFIWSFQMYIWTDMLSRTKYFYIWGKLYVNFQSQVCLPYWKSDLRILFTHLPIATV